MRIAPTDTHIKQVVKVDNFSCSSHVAVKVKGWCCDYTSIKYSRQRYNPKICLL